MSSETSLPAIQAAYKSVGSRINLDLHQGYITTFPAPNQPTPVLAAYSEAARHLRHNPEAALLSPAPRGPLYFHGIAARALEELLRQGRAVSEHGPKPAVRLNGLPPQTRTGACLAAESRFTRLLDSLHSGQDKGGQLFVHEGKPVLLRKGSGEPTALTLATIAIDRVCYFAGTLMALRLEGEPRDKPVAAKGLTIHGPSEIEAISPLRLTPWVLPKVIRRQVFSQCYREALHPDRLDDVIEEVVTYPGVTLALRKAGLAIA